MLLSVSKKQVLDRIRFENPWWTNGTIDSDYDKMSRRLYFELFLPLVKEEEPRRAIVLMGPRRVGKTVMLFHTVKALIDGGHDPRRILFITIENPIYNNSSLEQLYLLGKEAVGDEAKGKWIIIFDEIQYCKEWEVHLKSLVDSYRQDKFVVSGSAAAALKLASNESGAGRFTDFLLPPLTFHEYIHLKNLDGLMAFKELEWKGQTIDFYRTENISELNRHFIDYINYGGYPEVIFSETIQRNPGRYIRQDIIDKVLLRDLPSLYGISDTRELNSLFTTVAYNSGNEFSFENLCRESGIQKHTLKKYLEYLEAAHLIKRVRRIDHSGKAFRRDNFFKIYLTNPSLRSALFSPMEPFDDLIGNMVETAIFSQWMHRPWMTPWFARWKAGEVDMVGLNKQLKPIWALEIKWSNRYFEVPKDLKSLHKFCEENELDFPVVTTIDKEGQKTHRGITYQFFPAAAYAYTIGRNTLKLLST